MRKTLLSCVAASALALACTASAFAAVDYGETNSLQLAYYPEAVEATETTPAIAANSLTIGTGWNVNDAQVTLLVVKGKNPTTIQDTDILYIDQQAQADAATAFTTVGLLGETALPVGFYTVKLGGSNGDVVYDTFEIKEDAPVGTPVTLTWGDVNGDNNVTAADATAALSFQVNADYVKPGSTPYNIGSVITTTEIGAYTWGDVNGDNNVTAADATAMLSFQVNADYVKPGATPYSIGTTNVVLTVTE